MTKALGIFSGGEAMVTSGERRRNEVAVQPPEPSAAGLVFIGVIRTPWTSPRELSA